MLHNFPRTRAPPVTVFKRALCVPDLPLQWAADVLKRKNVDAISEAVGGAADHSRHHIPAEAPLLRQGMIVDCEVHRVYCESYGNESCLMRTVGETVIKKTAR